MSEKRQRIRRRADITAELISKVRTCSASGCNLAQTALITGFDEESLRRWMIGTFNEGRAQSVARAGAALYNMAVGDQAKGTRPNLSALIFYLKCQGGWRETTGIVFEEAKPTDENAARLIDLLETRFKRLGEIKQRKTDQREGSDAAPPPVAG